MPSPYTAPRVNAARSMCLVPCCAPTLRLEKMLSALMRLELTVPSFFLRLVWTLTVYPSVGLDAILIGGDERGYWLILLLDESETFHVVSM